jgi:hypothetical protein
MATSGAAEWPGRPRLWSAIALLLLLPAGFAIASWRDVKDVMWAEELRHVEIANGAAASYAGAEIRLAAFRVVTGESGDPRLETPPDRALALVRLDARATRDIDQLGWLGCALSVTDGAGRRWKPLFLSLSRDAEKLVAPDGQETKSCAAASLAPKPAGTRLLIEEKFLIPRDAIGTLEPTFSVASQRPAALRFAAAPERR